MNKPLSFSVAVRRLEVSDRELFRAHLLRLDPESRHDRFHGGASDDFLNHYADQCFKPGDVIFGAFIEGELRGAAELRPLSADPSDEFSRGECCHAEAAFSVERLFRGHGLGAQLFERLTKAAEENRIVEIDFTCSADNKAMQRLARKFTAVMHFNADHVTGRLRARRSSSLGSEAQGFAGGALGPQAPAPR